MRLAAWCSMVHNSWPKIKQISKVFVGICRDSKTGSLRRPVASVSGHELLWTDWRRLPPRRNQPLRRTAALMAHHRPQLLKALRAVLMQRQWAETTQPQRTNIKLERPNGHFHACRFSKRFTHPIPHVPKIGQIHNSSNKVHLAISGLHITEQKRRKMTNNNSNTR